MSQLRGCISLPSLIPTSPSLPLSTLSPQEILFHDDTFYCREHYGTIVAKKCAGCLGPIFDRFVELEGKQWHQQCFTCLDCNDSLINKPLYVAISAKAAVAKTAAAPLSV